MYLQVLSFHREEGFHLDGLNGVIVEAESLSHSDITEGVAGKISQLHPAHHKILTKQKQIIFGYACKTFAKIY